MEEKLHRTATHVFALYGRFFKHVAEEIGVEKTLELQAKAGKEAGERMGIWMKETKGVDRLDAETFLPILKEINDPFGYESTYEMESEGVILTKHWCPLYQSFKISGHGDNRNGYLCGYLLRAFFKGLKEVYPNMEYDLDFREDEEGRCVEIITIN
jgi:hypothetical protein